MKEALKQKDQLVQKPCGMKEEHGDGMAGVGQVREEE